MRDADGDKGCIKHAAGDVGEREREEMARLGRLVLLLLLPPLTFSCVHLARGCLHELLSLSLAASSLASPLIACCRVSPAAAANAFLDRKRQRISRTALQFRADAALCLCVSA